MRKAILFIPVLFIAISIIVSCTEKCNCVYVLNGEKLIKDVEMEKYEKHCQDQSSPYSPGIYTDSSGFEHHLPDTVPRVICE